MGARELDWVHEHYWVVEIPRAGVYRLVPRKRNGDGRTADGDTVDMPSWLWQSFVTQNALTFSK